MRREKGTECENTDEKLANGDDFLIFILGGRDNGGYSDASANS
jgi:hypothetical protein